MNTFQPVIKWSGSKRSQSNEIISYFPNEIKTYYEPFCGGCSVLRALIESDIKVNKYICSDINVDLIELWNVIKCDPISVYNTYEEFWNELNKDKDINRQKEYYNFIRDRFNKEKSPLDFICLNRTCFNGLIRYNSNGDFNTPFHINRPGIEPKKFQKIINEWSDLLNKHNVEFKICSYETIKPNYNDFVYLDPPYANTNGMYTQGFDNIMFFNWLKDVTCGWILSYNGKSGNEDNTYDVPKDLYDEHVYLKSGNSSFKRIKEVDKDAMVFESLYIKEGMRLLVDTITEPTQIFDDVFIKELKTMIDEQKLTFGARKTRNDLRKILLLGRPDGENLFLNNTEETAFFVLSDVICRLFREHNENGNIDELKLIRDFYEKIFMPLIRPIIQNNEKLIKELELERKYGMRITLLPEQINKILGVSATHE